MIDNQLGRRNLESIDKVPLLERKREILAGQAKERMEEGRNQHSPVVNLPQDTDKTRDSIAAEIAKAAYHSHRQHRTRSARCQVARRPQGIERDIGESSAIRESPAQQVASR